MVVGWDLRILQACLHVSSAAWPVLITLDRVRSDSRRCLSQRELSLVPHTIISLIRESWKLSNSHSELNFFHSVTKSWKFWPSCYLYVKNLRQRMVMFFLELQYSKNLCIAGTNFIPLPDSKIKLSFFFIYFSFFFDQCILEKWRSYYTLASFSIAAK